MKLYHIGLTCYFCVIALISSSANSLASSLPEIVKEGAFSTNGMHIIGVDSNNDKQLRWATWGFNSKQGMATVLALLRKTQNGVSIIWSIKIEDSYDPDLALLTSWRYRNHPIVAYTYSYGALARKVDLYGLSEKNLPAKLGEQLGEAVEWVISSKGEELMSVYCKPETHLLPICYRWGKKLSLEQVECK
jgi:hypothetical protein